MAVARIPSIEGGIQPTLLDAKADLITATANDTPARLGVGANNTVLTADSSTATGLKWAAPASSLPNYELINTGGTSLSGSSVTVSGISGKESLIIQIGGGGGSLLTNSSTFASFRMRINADTGANYNFINFFRINSATPETGNESSAGEEFIALGTFGGTANTHSIFANIMMFGCGATGKKSVQWNSNASGTGKSIQGTAIYAGTSAVTSLTFFSSAGTNSDAKVFIYGA